MVETEKLFIGMLGEMYKTTYNSKIWGTDYIKSINNATEFRLFYKRYEDQLKIFDHSYYVDILTGNKYESFHNPIRFSIPLGTIMVFNLSSLLTLLPNTPHELSKQKAFDLAIQVYNYCNEAKINFTRARKDRPNLSKVFKKYDHIYR